MKKVVSIVLSALLVLSSFAGLGDLFSYAAEDDVIEIHTVEDLYAINNDMSGNYKLMNDIDLSKATAPGGDYDYNGSGWEPIGSNGSYDSTKISKFTGCFDGNGYTISGIRVNLEITLYSGDYYYDYMKPLYAGFFSCNSGTIKNLDCEYDVINMSCTDSRSSTTSYHQYAYLGGITGYNKGTISNCCTTANVTLSKHNKGTGYCTSYFGGICGANSSTVEKCYFDGSIVAGNGTNRGLVVCGIAGSGEYSSDNTSIVKYSYNNGEIVGFNSSVYGIGYNKTVYECYNKGFIQNGYAISAGGSILCYYLNKTVSGYAENHSLTEEQMKDTDSFSGWDFDNVWVIDSHSDYPYPQLRSNRMDNKDIDQVKVKTKPSKTDYWTGDSIDSTDGKITIYYKNDTTKTIDMADYMFEDTELTETGSQTVTGYYLGIPFTFTANVTQRPAIVSLVVVNEPTKKTFVKGTSFDFSGCKIRATYEDSTVIDIEPTAENTEGGNINNTGSQTINYSLDGKTASFDVTVVPVEPVSIKITTKPTRTSWIEGEDINLYGMVVTATYNNGEKVNLKSTEYEVSELPTTVGEHVVTISYGDLTTELNLTITNKELQSIEVTTPPEITEYVIGQSLDRSGMVVKAAYSNGKMVEINDYTVSALPSEVGFGVATIEWGGKKTTTQVKMLAKEVEKIKVSTLPTKTTYIDGEDIKGDGIKVVKVYNDKSEVEVDDFTIATKTASGTGTKKVTVEWNGFTTKYDITVIEKSVTGITITPPTKTSYIDDEEFDAEGMVVSAVYDSGKTAELSEDDYDVTGFNSIDHYGLVTVKYETYESSFYVYRHTTGEWKTTTEPKCVEKGEKTLYCSECKQAIATEEIEAKNHSFGAWETITSPKCEEKGCEQRECSVCHVKETRDIDEKQHQWDDDYTVDKQAKCTEEGSKSIHCKNCDAVKDSTVIEALNHDEKTTITNATVDAAGRYLVTCNRCKETLTDKVIAKIDSIEFIDDEFVYDGEEQTPELIILDTNNHRLIADTDYTVEYSDNTEVGTAKAVISFDGNYDGTVVKKFSITKATEKYVVPSGLTAVYGQTLADVELTDNFSWMDDTLSVGNVGTNKFKVKYTPTDPKNKETIENIEVNVLVTKAVPEYEEPDDIKAVFGDSLRDVDLPEGWAWMDKSQSVGNVGTNKFKAKYTPDDTDNYSVVKDVELEVQVGKAVPSYEVPENLGATYGQKLSDVKLPENFTWNDNTQSVGKVGVNTFAATYTPTDKDNFKTVDNVKIQVKVEKAVPEYVAPTGLKAIWGQTLKDVELDEGFEWVAEDTSVGEVGTNKFTAKYTPEDLDNYNVVSNVEISVDVAKAVPKYEVPNGIEAVYGQKLSDVSLPDNFSWMDGTKSVGDAGIHEYKVKCVPTDTSHFEEVTNIIVQVDVKKATPSYDKPEAVNAVYGQKLSEIELPERFAWSQGDALVGNVGDNFAMAIYTPEDTDNYKVVEQIPVTIHVAKAKPKYEVPEELDAMVGEPLDNVELPEGFTWKDPSIKLDKAGSVTQKITYTPKDTDNYKVVNDIDCTFTVKKGWQKYVCPKNLTAEYGKTLADVNLPKGWSWMDDSIVLSNLGNNVLMAKYTPEDLDNYLVDENIEIEVFVKKGTPEYEVPTGLQATYGQKLSEIGLTDGFEWMNPSQSVGNAGKNTFKAKYVPDDEDNYKVIKDISIEIEVAKATPEYDVPVNLIAVPGDKLGTVALPAGFSWADAEAEVGEVGTREFEAVFTPEDKENYNVVEGIKIAVSVVKLKPEYTLPTNLTATYGDTLEDVDLPEGFAWKKSSESVGAVGVNNFKASYTPSNPQKYESYDNIDISVRVNKANPDYEVPSGLTAVYGQKLSEIGLPTGFTWIESTKNVGTVGKNTFKVKYIPDDIDSYKVISNIDVEVEVSKAVPNYVKPDDVVATYGDKLGDVELPDGWTWSESKTEEVGDVGINYFKAEYTPADTSNYQAVKNVRIAVQVKKAVPKYTVPTGLHGYCKQSLNDIKLPRNFSWMSPDDSVGAAGTNVAYVKYTPDDVDNYKRVNDIAVQVEVEKLNPDYSIPENLKATYGDKLGSVSLPSGFAWEDSNQKVGNVGTNEFTLKFTPDDTVNYKIVSGIKAKVVVEKANPNYIIPAGIQTTCESTLSSITLSEGWSWENPSKTVGSEGTRSFKAKYTPADTKNYNIMGDIDVAVTVNHKWNETYTTDQQKTCIVEGIKSIHCSGCNEVKADSVVKEPVSGHSWVHHESAAGYMTNGYAFDRCSVCGQTINYRTLEGYSTYYVSGLKVAKGKASFTVKWKKQTKNKKLFNGYQVRYSTDPGMGGAGYRTAGSGSASVKIKGAKKTRYYVQVRTYTGGFFSVWSPMKSVVTK